MLKELDNYILGITDECDLSKINNSSISLTEYEDVAGIIIKRKRESHKGSYGKVGILSGSKGMAGAAVLNCNAALRCGTGLVKACITDKIYNVVEAMSLEAITYAFEEENIDFIELNKELIEFSDAIATGSGCTKLKDYNKILNFLLENSNKPMVIDAEGINKINLDLIKGHNQKIILTPHFGEMARLLKCDISYIKEDIIEKTIDFSIRHDVFLILKGPRTLIACPDGKLYINTTGNPGMATAGSGDVLTGIIVSLVAQAINTKDALRTAVYLHGLSGDVGSNVLGETSLIAGDLISFLPEAIKMLMRK